VSKDMIASDPGIRTFMAGYSPRCELLQVVKGDAVRIYRLAYARGRLQSKWSQKGVKHGKRWRMRKAGARASAKIRQLVPDLHKKLAKISLHQLFGHSTCKISNLYNDPSAVKQN